MNKPTFSISNRFILSLSLWAGLTTGVLEVFIQLFRKFGLHQMIGAGLDIIWMTPLMDALIFLGVGLLYIPYARRFTRLNNIRVLIFVLAFLSAYTIINFLPIHWIARDILIIGLATACANARQLSRKKFFVTIQRTTLPLAILILLAGGGLFAYRWAVEQQAISKLPEPEPGLPNIVLIVMDTVRAENLSLYGYERKTTPVLEKLAHGGLVFEQAFSTASWTFPSHASMFTGRWPHELSTNWAKALDDTYATLGEVLQTQGYLTAGFVANTYYVTQEYGLGRGFIHYEDFDYSIGQFLASSSLSRAIVCYRQGYSACIFRKVSKYNQLLGRKNAQAINRTTMNWVADHHQRPFFIFINYFDAHAPYLAPKPYNSAFDPPRYPNANIFFGPHEIWDGTSEDTQAEENAYDETILYMDHEIGELIDQMRTGGLLDNTVFLITSDHGEEFREHGAMDHGNSLYRQSVQVPLLIFSTDQTPAGERVDEPVSLRNIPATVMDIVGRSGSSVFPGYSLMETLGSQHANPASRDEYILNEITQMYWQSATSALANGDMKSIESAGLRYILNGDGSEELYDFNLDLQEQNDLARTPQGQAVLPKYRGLLEKLLAQTSAQ